MKDLELDELWTLYHKLDREMADHPGRAINAEPEEVTEFDVLRRLFLAVQEQIAKVSRG